MKRMTTAFGCRCGPQSHILVGGAMILPQVKLWRSDVPAQVLPTTLIYSALVEVPTVSVWLLEASHNLIVAAFVQPLETKRQTSSCR